MKIVYSWLNDFVNIKDIPILELADALTNAGLEVASVSQRKIPQGIKVAKILETTKHPNADKLKLCKVDAGSQLGILDIVCGAPNASAGMTIPLATIGTEIAPDFIIKKSKIRGELSSGMLCSEKELGISDEHGGLMVLPDTFELGKELSDYFPNDPIIEIEITPDRGDCLSMLGVAREVAARYSLQLQDTAKTPAQNNAGSINDYISVNLQSSKCPRYLGRLVKGVTIAPSPEWLQQRLIKAGIRPINNVVDITNFILLHFGQPMHAFDYNCIRGRKIIVRESGAETNYKTLDGIERKIIADDLLICDNEGPVALAGIMGGSGSEIADSTKDVFLECAFFDPIAVRKTSKRLNLSTDSSYRFERGVDYDKGLVDAINTAASLLEEIAGGTTVDGLIDCYPSPIALKKVNVRASKVSRVLGVNFTLDTIYGYLTSLGMQSEKVDSDTLLCTIPSFRHDMSFEEDFIEEVGRMYGYDNIPASMNAPIPLLNIVSPTEKLTDTIRSAMAFAGFNELVTNTLTSEKKVSILTPSVKPVDVINPLNPDMAKLRTTLAGTMLETLSFNLNRKNINNHFFEIGKKFYIENAQIIEKTVLTILIEGNFWGTTWNSKPLAVDFYILKGIIENFASYIGVGFSYSSPETKSELFEEEVAQIKSSSITGVMGKISKKICSQFDISSTVYMAELDITTFITSEPSLPKYKTLARFPALERDFCFVMPESLKASSVIDEIFTISPLVEAVHPFDVYRGEKLGDGIKSIAFSVKLRSSERTLSDQEAEGICNQIIDSVRSKLGAQLRS